ncbi:MAG: hypothetical protein WC763_06370 [Candidatus Paceibacterota bacterium]|jgi:hypothetical protein
MSAAADGDDNSSHDWFSFKTHQLPGNDDDSANTRIVTVPQLVELIKNCGTVSDLAPYKGTVAIRVREKAAPTLPQDGPLRPSYIEFFIGHNQGLRFLKRTHASDDITDNDTVLGWDDMEARSRGVPHLVVKNADARYTVKKISNNRKSAFDFDVDLYETPYPIWCDKCGQVCSGIYTGETVCIPLV